MSKKRKFILGKGLAFAEEKDMKKLEDYSKEGWHFKEIKWGLYLLEKGEPTNYIYCIDYQKLKDEDREEYIEMLNNGGWTFIVNYEDMILLRAKEGTEKIYTDISSRAIREEKFGSVMGKSALYLIAIILLMVIWRFTIGSLINIAAINFITTLITAGLIGFTFVFIIGYFNVKLKANKYKKQQ